MRPASKIEAQDLLASIGAPPRLIRHVELVGEAAELLLACLEREALKVDLELIRVGVVLHDVGKTVHPNELDGAGGEHEPAGESLLLARGVTPEVARICRSHARWPQMDVSLEELIVALADKLWKGVRNAELEKRVVDEIASLLGKDRWSLFVTLDTAFEQIAEGGAVRLERSRYFAQTK